MLLSLFVITVIQLTSSQPTYDVTQQKNDVATSCGGTEQVLGELVTEKHDRLMMAVSQLEEKVESLSGNKEQVLSKLVMAVSQLQQKVEALGGNNDSCTNVMAKGTVL